MKFGLRHLVLMVTTLVALGLNAAALMRQSDVHAQTTRRAAVVVRFGDGHAEKKCVAFTEDTISGYELLRRSGLPVVADQSNGMGAAICKIGNDGCDHPAEDCFCKFNTEQKYWSFWQFQNGAWVYSGMGASSTVVKEGEVQGWSWGSGSQSGAANSPPPLFTFDQICNIAPTSIPTAVGANLIGGGQVISATITTLVPTAVQANAPVAPAPSPVAGVTVVAVVAVPVPTFTPAAIAPTVAVPTAEVTLTPTPTFTPEPTISSTSALTPTFTPEPTLSLTLTITSTFTSTFTPTPTFTPEPTLSSTSTIISPSPSTSTSTPTPPETPAGPNPLGYALFGVIALGLIGGITLTRMRR